MSYGWVQFFLSALNFIDSGWKGALFTENRNRELFIIRYEHFHRPHIVEN